MKFTVIVVAFSLSLGAVATFAKSQIGHPRQGMGTILPDFGEIQRNRLEIMSAEVLADREEAEEAAQHRPQLIVEETRKLAAHIEQLYIDAGSEDPSEKNLKRRSEDIGESTRRLTELVNYGSDPPQINVASLPDAGLETRVQLLVHVSRRLIPNLIHFVGDDLINLDLLNQIRDDLAITEALSRTLPDSEF